MKRNSNVLFLTFNLKSRKTSEMGNYTLKGCTCKSMIKEMRSNSK